MSNFSLGSAQLDTVVSLTGLDAGLNKAKSTAMNSVRDLGNSISSTLGFALVGGLGAIGGAVGYVGGQTLSLAQDVNKAQRMLSTQLEMTAEEAKATAETVKAVWANNFGGSIEEVREDLTAVYQNMQRFGEVSQAELQRVTEDAIRLKDAFGADVAATTNAAGALVTLGATWDEAMDIIAAGNRRGLNTSGDFLETVSEYGPYFEQAGFSAEEMFSILETGLMAGVQGTDKVGDLIKEFGIRLTDGSKATREGFTAIGVDYDNLVEKLNTGQVTGAQVFDDTIAKLKAMDDQVLANQIGVSLFGTQWEDMTSAVIYGINTQNTAMADITGSTDALNVQYSDLGSAIEGMKRRFIASLEPLASSLLDITNMVMPSINAAIGDFGDELAWVGQVGEDFVTTLKMALAGEWVDNAEVIMPIHRLAGALGLLLKGDYSGAIESFKNLFGQLVEMAKGSLPLIQDAVMGVLPLVGDALKAGLPIIGGAVLDLLMGLGSLIMEYGPQALPVLVEGLQWLINQGLSMLGMGNIQVDLSWLTGLFDGAMPHLQMVWGILEPLVSNLMLIFSNLKASAEQNGGPLIDTLGKLGDTAMKLAPILGGILVYGLGVMTSTFAGVAAAIGPIVEGILGILGGLATAVGGIADILSGAFLAVTGVISGDGKLVEAGLNQIKNGALNVWEGLKSGTISAFTGLADGALALIGGMGEGIINYFGTLYENLTGQKMPQIVTDLMTHFRRLKEDGLGYIEELWHEAEGKFNEAKATLVRGAEAIGRGIANGIRDTIISAVTYVKSVLNQVIDIFNNAITAFNGLGGPQMALIPKLAQGTHHWGGGWAQVGEFGPELMYVPEGGQVIPAAKSATILNRRGESPVIGEVVNHIYNDLDEEALLYRLMTRLQEARL